MQQSIRDSLLAIKVKAPGVWRVLKSKFILPSRLTLWAQSAKKNGQSIATVNGCFDILHLGHFHLLCESKAQADLLLLAINSDKTIANNKGETRPIHPLAERLVQGAMLSSVDFITYFEEPNPNELLKSVKPDVHVNGSEYGPHCVESEVLNDQGGRLHLVDPVKGYSTTAFVDKLRGSI